MHTYVNTTSYLQLTQYIYITWYVFYDVNTYNAYSLNFLHTHTHTHTYIYMAAVIHYIIAENRTCYKSS